jgi:hypothetical protein
LTELERISSLFGIKPQLDLASRLLLSALALARENLNLASAAALFSAAFSSFHDSAAIESAAVAGLGGRAVGVKAIGSVLGNGLTRNGRLKASRR